MQKHNSVISLDTTEPLVSDKIFNNEGQSDDKENDIFLFRGNRIPKFSKALLLYCIPLVVLFLMLPYFAIRDQVPYQQVDKKFIAARWSWTFSASEVLNSAINEQNYGPEYILNLGSGPGCGQLKWQPFFVKNKTREHSYSVPFFLQYVDGPYKLHALRSILLTTGDGREIMAGNDFHRDGFVYSIEQFDLKVWALNSTLLADMLENEPLTLKIEVFVDLASTGCNYREESPEHPLNYEEECERLPTNAKLYVNGSCYVGSNTRTRFAHAIQMCNDIPSAAISRLAWIETEELLDKLRKVLVNKPYYIGAKQFTESSQLSPKKSWFWIDSDTRAIKPFPENFSLWAGKETVRQSNYARRHYAAIFMDPERIGAVHASEWLQYLCEYRGRE